MEFQKRQFPRLEKRPIAFVVVAVAASLMLAWAGPAQAKRMLGTKGPDKIAGTAKADVVKGRGGDDRIKGRGGRDRLFGGRGADRLNAVDGRRDRRVSGGPGNDVCRIDAADRPNVKGCETVKVAKGGGPGGSRRRDLAPARRRTPGLRPASWRGLRRKTRRRPSAIRSTRSRSPSTPRWMG